MTAAGAKRNCGLDRVVPAREVVPDEARSAQRIHDEFRVDGIAVDDENVGRGYALRLLSLLHVVPSAQMLHTEISAHQNLRFLAAIRFAFSAHN